MTPEREALIRRTWEDAKWSPVAMGYLDNGRVNIPIRHPLLMPLHDFTTGPPQLEQMQLTYIRRTRFDDMILFRLDEVVCEGIIVAQSITPLPR